MYLDTPPHIALLSTSVRAARAHTMPTVPKEKQFFLRFDEVVAAQDPLIVARLIEEHATGASFLVRETVSDEGEEENPHRHVVLTTRTSEKKLRALIQAHWTGNKQYAFKSTDGNTDRLFQYCCKGKRDEPAEVHVYDGTAWEIPTQRIHDAHEAYWIERDTRPLKKRAPENNVSKMCYALCKKRKLMGSQKAEITGHLIDVYKGVWKPVQVHQMVGIVNLVSLMLDENDECSIKRDIIRQVIDRC